MRTGSFAGPGEPDTVIYEGFRSSVQINAPGGWQNATARVSIKGMARNVMERLTIINYTNMENQRNEITIGATGADGEYNVLFVGTIGNAFVDYNGAPDVSFVIEAYQCLFDATQPSPPTSWPGPNKVADMAANIAGKFGYRLINNGVDTTITDQVLVGSYYNQLRDLCHNARCALWVDSRSFTASIAPINTPLEGPEVEVSAETGLIGWPTPNHLGVSFMCLYNPAIYHGGVVKLTTSVSVSSMHASPEKSNQSGDSVSLSGKWFVAGMEIILDCETPGGAWFMNLTCYGIRQAVRTR
jgi:hypothetical protein